MTNLFHKFMNSHYHVKMYLNVFINKCLIVMVNSFSYVLLGLTILSTCNESSSVKWGSLGEGVTFPTQIVGGS